MSVQAMAWALAQQIVTEPTQRHVLLCISNYANVDGTAAFASTSTLAVDTGLSERTVRYKIDALLEAGVLRRGNQAIVAAYIDRPDRRPVCYDVVMSADPLGLARGAGAAARSERGANGAGTGCSSRSNGVQMAPERGAGAAPNPPLNPPNEPSTNPKRSPASTAWVDAAKAVALPSWLPHADWCDFVDHRLAIKAPLTARACELSLSELAKVRERGLDPVASIRQTVQSGRWTGLFAPRDGADAAQESPRQREAREFHERSSGGLLSRRPPAPPALPGEVING